MSMSLTGATLIRILIGFNKSFNIETLIQMFIMPNEMFTSEMPILSPSTKTKICTSVTPILKHITKSVTSMNEMSTSAIHTLIMELLPWPT